MNSSGALWKIATETPVGDFLYNWHDEQYSQFTDGINSVGNSVGKNDTSLFFNKKNSHHNSLGIYRGNISVGKIAQKFTDGNILSVFLFVFIDFFDSECNTHSRLLIYK
jgi:hypothetical protein